MDPMGAWPKAWDQWKNCILIAVPRSGGKQDGQGAKAKAWKAPLPHYWEEVLAWLVGLGIYFYLVGFSRGAVWGAQLLARCPTNITGVLLCAGYPPRENQQDELEAARALLKLEVPLVIAHSLTDCFSAPDRHPSYWETLCDARTRNANLIMETFQTGTHDEFLAYSEGVGQMNVDMDTSFQLRHWYLLSFLQEAATR